jgi:NADPH2:quinone reductase
MATLMMKEIIVHPLPELHTSIHEVKIPTPGPDEIIVRVVVAGSNVKDWDHLTNLNIEINSGDDGAGFVHALGIFSSFSSPFHILHSAFLLCCWRC